MNRALFASLLAALVLGVPSASRSAPAKPDPTPGVVRVRVTSQAHDFLRPWLKRPPATREAVGAVLAGDRVLVTGELVANHTYIELEHPTSGEKAPARLAACDYDANLALVEPSGPSFLSQLAKLEISTDPVSGDRMEATQFEASGAPMQTPLTLTTVEIGSYPISEIPLLIYRLSGSLQQRDGSFALPILRGGKLAGLVMRYDPRSQASDAVSVPVIRRFLAQVADGGKTGFPRAGVAFAPTRDPQLRRFLGLKNGTGGVLITAVDPLGPAAEAGIQKGDVLLEVDGKRIDQDGNYEDPRHGRLGLAHILSMAKAEPLPFQILREGKPQNIPVAVRPRVPSESVSPPYQLDSAPRYLVLGGLVFQELGRQVLREWGPGWDKRAPQRLVYLDRFQSELFPEGKRRIVFLSQILPSPATLGYEEVGQHVVERVNGKEIRSLEDLEAALAAPVDGFHQIDLDGDPHRIVIDPAEAARIAPALMRHYGLGALKRF